MNMNETPEWVSDATAWFIVGFVSIVMILVGLAVAKAMFG